MPGPTSNLDAITSTDRNAPTGPQPDNTPVGGGSSSGGGGGAPSGPAGGDLAGTYPNPTLKVIGAAAGPIGDATHVAQVTVDAKGRVTVLASVAIAVGGVGTVTSVATAGRGASSVPNPIVGAGTITNFDPDHFNVKDYGAQGDDATDDYAAIAATIAAGIATGKSWCLYFPPGIYKSTHATPINNSATFSSVMVKGEGDYVSMIRYSDTAGDAGMIITKSGQAGAYNSDDNVEVMDLGFISSGNQNANALKLAGPSPAGSGTPSLSRITRCAFESIANDVNHYWTAGVWLSDFNNVIVSECKFFRTDTGVLITGTSGATSVFYIERNDFQGGTFGVKADGTGGLANRIEGVFCRGNSFVQQTYAVWAENSNTGGGLEVSGGQINQAAGAAAGIHVKGYAGIAIHGIPSFTTVANAVEILDACWAASVKDCFFATSTVGSKVRGVYIAPTGGAIVPQGSVNTVSGNSFTGFNNGFAGSCNVEFATGTTRSNCSNNVADAGAYTDGGAADNFNNNI